MPGFPNEGSTKCNRGAATVNPVTGELRRIDEPSSKRNDGLVTEGCLKIPKEYLYAATEAGLGSSNGTATNNTCGLF